MLKMQKTENVTKFPSLPFGRYFNKYQLDVNLILTTALSIDGLSVTWSMSTG